MVRGYVENSSTVILAVIPANMDTATQEILTMATDVDPTGKQTLDCNSQKPDLVFVETF
jgi:hypothetical protein